ncbi:hypothetical protein ABE493_07695 [Stenotrophomonas terrae]|uniref:hypothetical protein n=1 Tax=Stenotrophomonas terrae TaxID=405446 RepID=UPI00320A1EE7
MRSHKNQLDIFDHDPAVRARQKAHASREAAVIALVDPHWTPTERRERNAHYLAEAERFDAEAHEGFTL